MPDAPNLHLVADNAAPPPRETMGLDPVSSPGFDEVLDVAPDPKPPHYYGGASTSPPAERQSEFSRATWAMIVVAGIALGFAAALMLSGI